MSYPITWSDGGQSSGGGQSPAPAPAPAPAPPPTHTQTQTQTQTQTPAATALRWRPLPCGVATSAAYVALYGLSNQLTSLRTDVGAGVFAWERAIPFVGWTVVPYLSICVFFALSFFIDTDAGRLRRHVMRLLIVLVVSVLCYAAFPLRFTFERPATQGLTGLLFEVLGHCDMPYNRAPSLHIGVLVLLWARFAPVLRGAWAVGLHAWFALIGVSVLTTYQHHVMDVPAGAALGVVAIVLTAGSRRSWNVAGTTCDRSRQTP